MLIVDQHLKTVDALVEYFTPHYAVYTALNGTDGLMVVLRVRPDLVILDVDLPDMRGLDVLRQMKRVEPAMPIIVLTANEEIAVAAEVLTSGAFAYIAKPSFSPYLDHLVAAAPLGPTLGSSPTLPRRASAAGAER